MSLVPQTVLGTVISRGNFIEQMKHESEYLIGPLLLGVLAVLVTSVSSYVLRLMYTVFSKA